MQRGRKIISFIVSLAELFGVKIVAEGIETREEVMYLKSMGCTWGQGYYFAHPKPREEFEQMLLVKQTEQKKGQHEELTKKSG